VNQKKPQKVKLLEERLEETIEQIQKRNKAAVVVNNTKTESVVEEMLKKIELQDKQKREEDQRKREEEQRKLEE